MSETSLKKALLLQLTDLVQKGEITEQMARTLITKVELSDERLIKMALDKFESLRKTDAKG